MSRTGMQETRGPKIGIDDPIDMRIIACGSVILGDDWSYPDLCAPFWRLYLNHDHGAMIGLGAQRLPIGAGVPCLIPPWLHWRAIPGCGVRHGFLHVVVPGLSDATVRRCFPRPLQLPGADLAALIAAACAGLAGGVSAPGLLNARAAASLALARAAANLPTALAGLVERQLLGRHPLREVAAAIADDPGAAWSVVEIARRLGCSTDHATRLFRRHLGDTPARVVAGRRLSAAARRLSDSADPIDTVAEACGFADRFSFSRAFSRRFGCGPAAWRQRSVGGLPVDRPV